MSEYRAVILDLDGTVVESEPEAIPSKDVTEAIREARNNDVLISVATGRPYEMAKTIFRRLGLVEFCVVNGGPEIVDPVTEQVVVRQIMTRDAQAEVIQIAHRYGERVHDSLNQRLDGQPLRHLWDIPVSNPKLLIPALEMTKAREIVEALGPVENAAAFLATSWWPPGNRFDVHVTDAEATKAHGIALLMDMLNIVKRETIGVGDSDNDKPMFDEVGLKIAMDNATDELKERADVIAPSLNEDGVAWVLKRFFGPNGQQQRL